MVKSLFKLLFIGLIVGLIAAAFYGYSGRAQEEKDSKISDEGVAQEEVDNVVIEEDRPSFIALSVTEIEPGFVISIDYVSFSVPGYLVVYRSADGNDVLTGDAEIVGSSVLLMPGIYEELEIDLNEELFSGDEIIIAQHSDDGDGEFSYPGGLDIPLMRLPGQPFIKKITIK